MVGSSPTVHAISVMPADCRWRQVAAGGYPVGSLFYTKNDRCHEGGRASAIAGIEKGGADSGWAGAYTRRYNSDMSPSKPPGTSIWRSSWDGVVPNA